MTTDRGQMSSLSFGGNLVPTWMALLRKTRVLAKTSSRSGAVQASVEDFVEHSVRIADAAADRRLLDQKILALWELEGLAFAFFERCDDEVLRIGDLGLPPEAGPPVHCGVAMAEVLKHGFDADRLLNRFEVVTDPAFAPFAIETVGLMLAVYERDFLGLATSLLGRIGVVRHTPLRRPPLRSFLESVPPEHWPYIAHGYGRALYFKQLSLAGALGTAQRQEDLAVEATVRGVAAAYTLINSRELGRVLSLQGSDSSLGLRDGIEGGMMNTLVLLEWTFPGCLSSVDGATDRGYRLIDKAAELADSARGRGHGPQLVP